MQASSRIAAVLLAVVIGSGAVAADTACSTRPVKIPVGAIAGGGTDIIARMLAAKFQQSLEQPVVVGNKPGAPSGV